VVHIFSSFQRRNIYIIVIQLMTDATADRITELEIMIRLKDNETVNTRTRPYLTVLDHVFVLEP